MVRQRGESCERGESWDLRELSQSDERWVEIKEIEKMKQTNNILNGGIINFFL